LPRSIAGTLPATLIVGHSRHWVVWLRLAFGYASRLDIARSVVVAAAFRRRDQLFAAIDPELA